MTLRCDTDYWFTEFVKKTPRNLRKPAKKSRIKVGPKITKTKNRESFYPPHSQWTKFYWPWRLSVLCYSPAPSTNSCPSQMGPSGLRLDCLENETRQIVRHQLRRRPPKNNLHGESETYSIREREPREHLQVSCEQVCRFLTSRILKNLPWPKAKGQTHPQPNLDPRKWDPSTVCR